jgi:hypothetical protein
MAAGETYLQSIEDGHNKRLHRASGPSLDRLS